MNSDNDTSNHSISKMASPLSNTEVVSGDASVPAYDQWQHWAQKQKHSKRKEAESLLYGDSSTSSCDETKVQQFMELPRKDAAAKRSLLDDDDDEDDSETDSQAPWKMLQQQALRHQQRKTARNSLLDDDDSDDEEDLGRELPRMPLGPDALFLPPTSLKRSSPIVPLSFTSKRNLFVTAPSFSSRSGGSSLSSGNSSSRSLLNKSLTFESSATTPKSMSSSTSGAGKSPVPLSLITAMSSRRRYTLTRNGSLPAV